MISAAHLFLLVCKEYTILITCKSSQLQKNEFSAFTFCRRMSQLRQMGHSSPADKSLHSGE